MSASLNNYVLVFHVLIMFGQDLLVVIVLQLLMLTKLNYQWMDFAHVYKDTSGQLLIVSALTVAL